MKDGPIVVQGDFKIIKQDGTEFKKVSMTSFCRCGHSNNMPFCDGTHRKKGFQD
ncbi:MAG: CDGSH iron-sulfur domain-containing protein [Bacteroidales bacterium]|nr:CDGSH iron-sulfur domain-containing protein [Bacteroidales bacterium]